MPLEGCDGAILALGAGEELVRVVMDRFGFVAGVRAAAVDLASWASSRVHWIEVSLCCVRDAPLCVPVLL